MEKKEVHERRSLNLWLVLWVVGKCSSVKVSLPRRHIRIFVAWAACKTTRTLLAAEVAAPNRDTISSSRLAGSTISKNGSYSMLDLYLVPDTLKLSCSTIVAPSTSTLKTTTFRNRQPVLE